jgi:choline dehydrogenase
MEMHRGSVPLTEDDSNLAQAQAMRRDHSRKPKPPLQATFDYLVVGAGTAGCILAARLSEIPGASVALLEAGTAKAPLLSQLPLGFGKALSDARLTWQFRSEAEAKLGGRHLIFPRGRLLGGSSAINGMVHTRGLADDFDAWAADGCAGWSGAAVEPYFARAERRLFGAGPVPTLGPPPPIAKAFLRASESGVDGAAILPNVAISSGKRVSAVRALPRSVTVFRNCRVERVLLREGRAYGVSARQDQRTVAFEARREVILCAGSFQSPNILFHSGIGDGDTLRENSIPVTHHSPRVGRNLQDHFGVALAWETTRVKSLNSLMKRPAALAVEAFRWAILRRGALARPLAEALLFARTTPEAVDPDVELVLRIVHGSSVGGLHADPSFSINAMPLKPHSRGHVRPRGNDPTNAPVIIPNYLTAKADIDTSLRAIRLARGLVASPELRPFANMEIAPGASVAGDAELLDYLKAHGASAAHHVGTCAMGGDDGAVVDPHLRVNGIQSLRVVDASVMPNLPTAHTNAVTMMIGERAGDLMARTARCG